MFVPLPEMDYYSLKQVSKRWSICKQQVQHYIETDKLPCCIWIKPMWMNLGRMQLQANGREVFQPQHRIWVKTTIRLFPFDCMEIFRKGKALASFFRSTKDSSQVLRLDKIETAITIKKADLFILRKDVEWFEQTYQIDNPATQSASTLFSHSDDYQTVKFRGESMRFGFIQASIIKQLHEISLTNQPWCHGKILLKNSGSQSEQVKDIFSSKANWREVIESDGRGYYRLRI